jgi:hypothetical protein
MRQLAFGSIVLVLVTFGLWIRIPTIGPRRPLTLLLAKTLSKQYNDAQTSIPSVSQEDFHDGFKL